MPAVSKAQQKFMGMVHAAQKSEDPSPFSKDVKKAADSMSDKAAKDFASTKHKGLPDHVKEGNVTDRPEEPTEDDLDGMPSAAITPVSTSYVTNEGPLGTMRDTKPTPTNDILWKATGRVCEGRGMAERVKMYEKKGGGWRMGKHVDETVYTTLGEFYKNEIKPRKEAKELMVKRRMGEGTGSEAKEIAGLTGTRDSIVQKFIDDYNLNAKNLVKFISKGKEKIRKDFATAMAGRPGNRYQGDFVGMFGEGIVNEVNYKSDGGKKEKIHFGPDSYTKEKEADYFDKEWDKETNGDEAILKGIIKNFEETIKLLKKKLDGSKKLSPASKENIKKSISVNTNLLNTYKQNLKNLSESVLKEDDMQEPGGDVVATNGTQDHEVSMAKASLMSIGKAVQDLMGRLGDKEKDIPGWIQDHITNAENYIVQASKGYYDQEDKKLGNNIPRPENQLTHSNNGK